MDVQQDEFSFYCFTLFHGNWPRVQFPPPLTFITYFWPQVRGFLSRHRHARLFAKFHWLTLALVSILFPIPFLFS